MAEVQPKLGDVIMDGHRKVWHACQRCGKQRWVRVVRGQPEHLKCNSCSRIKHGGSHTRLFRTWWDMLQRCLNKNIRSYKRYGGRNIYVIPKWQLSFENFERWALANGYNDTLTIDRINNNEGYMPQNCQWLTLAENSAKDHKRTPVNQLDLTGNLIATYPSIIESSKVTGIRASNISKCCRGDLKRAGGYLWCYSSTYVEPPDYAS